jgi:glutamyl endopeptidase
LLLVLSCCSLFGTALAAESPSACYARCAAEVLGAVFSSAASSSSPQQHGPVCGSDGRSYANGCLASCAGTTAASQGYCEGDRLRFAGAGLPLLPASLLPFERAGEGEGRPSLAEDGQQQQQRRNPTEALAERMALFAEEGFRYVGRTQLAPSVRRQQRRLRKKRQQQPRESGGGGGSPAAASSSSTPATTTTSVEVFRATPQGDLYVARYDVPQDEARRAGAAAAAVLYRPADPNAAREAFLERRQQPSRAEREWPVVAAAALVPEIGNRGGGGGEALERQLSALMAAPGGGNNGTTAAVVAAASGDALLDGVKWPVVDVSACLKNETSGKDGAAAAENDFVPPPPPQPPASRRMLRSKNAAAPLAHSSSSSPTRTLSSILGPDERRRCPLSAEPALPEAVFARAMAEGRATLAAGGTIGKPANLTTSSGSFTRGEGGGGGGGANGRGGDAGARAAGGKNTNSGSTATLPPHAPPPAYGARWPYSALGQLETRDEAGERVCTGALVGPDTVLTAAHCVWDDATYAFVAAPDFSPGRYRDGCRLVSPWGVVKWKHATIFRAYADTWEQDVAIIKLDAPVGWRTGWLGMRASCGSADDGGGAGSAAGAPSSSPSSSSSSPARQTRMSIAGYPLMPTRDGDGECLVAQCDVRLREPDAGTGQCPSDASPSAVAAAALPTNPLTAHSCDTAPGQSGAPLYDSEGYARAIHVLGISVGEPDNGATTLTPWVMANVARWVKGQQQGGGGGGGVPEGEPMAAAGKGRPPPAAAPVGPVPDAIRSLMDTNGTLPLDKPEEWQKNFS